MPELEKLVKVKLDKERHLRLTLKGMLEFEKLTGKNILKGFNFKDLTLEDTAGILWACLIHEDKELTFDDVLCKIDLKNITKVLEALTDCINQSLPESEGDASPLVEKPHSG